jgi:esterase/lipase superfamily enzyme
MKARVYGRALFVVGSLALCAGDIRAQQASPEPAMSEVCRAAANEKLPALEKRRRDLERDVARKTAAMTAGATRKDKKAAPDSKAQEESLRKSQEDLLETLFQIDCVKTRESAPPPVETVRRRGPPAPKASAGDAIEVVTYYATNRSRTESAEPAKFYGSGVESALQYGRAVVTIPLSHTPGTIELPKLWKLERAADPSKHFVLKSVTPFSVDAARIEMTERLQAARSKALLLFVHGYYVGFYEAALRTAQIAHDLKFQGVAFFYSWPSANKALAYWQDAEAAQISVVTFEQLLEDLSKLPVSDIYVLAHSMGNRIVTHALQSRVEKGKETKHLRELLLAAPDINADLFRTVIAPRLAALQDTRTTVYASSSDLALMASKVVHGFRRVGETVGGVLTYPGVETIDASSASPATRAFGHSYVVDSPSVMKDIEGIIERKGQAHQRGLKEAGSSPNTYWQLR